MHSASFIQYLRLKHILVINAGGRYLKSFYDNGLLNTTLGFNVQDECKKVKGIARIVAHVDILIFGYNVIWLTFFVAHEHLMKASYRFQNPSGRE